MTCGVGVVGVVLYLPVVSDASSLLKPPEDGAALTVRTKQGMKICNTSRRFGQGGRGHLSLLAVLRRDEKSSE